MAEANTYKMVGGQYRLHEGDKPVAGDSPLDDISLALDLGTGELLKHGHPVILAEYFGRERARRKCSNPAAPESLVVLTGRIPVGEVNRCLLEPGYARVVWDRVHRGTQEPEPRETGMRV